MGNVVLGIAQLYVFLSVCGLWGEKVDVFIGLKVLVVFCVFFCRRRCDVFCKIGNPNHLELSVLTVFAVGETIVFRYGW